MKLIPVEQSIGMMLAHDMTEIIPGKYKHTAFKKGHIIEREDIPRLLNMGKERIGIIEYKDGDVHENDAAIRIAKAAAGQGIIFSEPSEGKVNLIAKCLVLGLPGCVMYSKRTIFDLVVPRLVAGERVTRKDIIMLGHGGLCAGCNECRYPNCGFGKGGQ